MSPILPEPEPGKAAVKELNPSGKYIIIATKAATSMREQNMLSEYYPCTRRDRLVS